jgi:hypothetical protein
LVQVASYSEHMISPSPAGRPPTVPTDENTPSGIPATKLGFQPVVNGVDFLDSAITHLLKPHDARSVKYAVLHLQAAIEILVKVRLQRERSSPGTVDHRPDRAAAHHRDTVLR